MFEFLIAMINVFSYIIPLNYLFPNNNRNKYLTIICVSLTTIAFWLIDTPFDTTFHTEFLLLTIFFAFIAINYRKVTIELCFIFFVLHLIGFISIIIILIIASFYTYEVLEANKYLFVTLYEFIKLLGYVSSTLYFKQLFDEYKDLNLKRILLIMVPIGVMMLLIFEGYFIYHDSLLYNIIIISTVFVVIYVFKLIKKQYLVESKNQKMIMYQKIIEASNYQSYILEDKVNEIRMIKHDMLNKLAIIQSLVHENKKDEVIKYMQDLIGEIETESYYILTDYQYINAILNYKINRNPKIRFNVILEISDISTNIELDICTILSNLIDNAIEEIDRNEFHKPFININIKQIGHMVLIKCENQLKIQKSMETEKIDRENHGLGLKIIENIVNKHSGDMIIDQDDIFSVRVLLQLRQ